MLANQLIMKDKLFMICDCHSLEHQLIFWKPDDKEYSKLYVYPHLIHRGFGRRIVSAFKYIFGYKSRYGAWDEFIFNNENLLKLKTFLNDIEL